MNVDEQKTDGVTVANQTVTDSQPANTATEAAPGNAEPKLSPGLQKRFDQLTAINGSERSKREAAEAKLAEVIEANKTESEKRVDEMVSERVETTYGPKLKELERANAYIQSEFDGLLAQLPEESKDIVTDDSVDMLTRIRIAKQLVGAANGNGAATINSAGNTTPDTTTKSTATYTMDQYNEWLASRHNNKTAYEALKPEMQAALREGRVSK